MKKGLFGTIVILLFTLTLNAQIKKDSIKTEDLNEVFLSSKIKLNKKHSGKNIIKITAKDIESLKGISLPQLINMQSGIEILGTKSNSGQPLSYFIRGGNNRQVLILIDGMTISDPSQIAADYDLNLIDLNTVESIEIIKGASSTLYGNNAASAVINITTKKSGKDKIAGNVTTQIGTDQTKNDTKNNIASFNSGVNLNGTINKLTYLTSFTHFYSDGISVAKNGEEKDAFNRINVDTKIGYQINKKWNINTSANHTKFKSEFDNGFPIEDADFYTKNEQNRIALNSNYNYSKGKLVLNTSYTNIFRNYQSNYPNTYNGESYFTDIYNNYKLTKDIKLITGISYIKTKTIFSDSKFTETIDPYLSVLYISDFGLDIKSGIRLNNHSEYGNHITYSINPSYRFNLKGNYIKLMGSLSTAYIAPTLNQLYGPFGANLDLEPEENLSGEFGIEYNHNHKYGVTTTLFHREEDNFIDYIALDNTFTIYGYDNITQTNKVQGAEVEFFAKPIKQLELRANYTFVEKKNTTQVRIPKHKININGLYKFNNKSSFSLNYQYLDKRTDIDFSIYQNKTLKAYSLINAYYNREIIKNRMSANISITNILNEEYTEVIGYNTKGRNYSLGFNIKL